MVSRDAAGAKEPRRFADQRFVGLAPGELELEGAIVLGCTFVDCDLSEASFARTQLADCSFNNCEMPLVNVTGTVLQTVAFDTCRLTGVVFSAVSKLPIVPEATFKGCDLSFCSFRELDLRACSFEECRLHESDFMRCELEEVSFAGADLSRCTFQRNGLVKADLRGARGYQISPLDNNLRGMKVSLPEAIGLLAAIGVEVG